MVADDERARENLCQRDALDAERGRPILRQIGVMRDDLQRIIFEKHGKARADLAHADHADGLAVDTGFAKRLGVVRPELAIAPLTAEVSAQRQQDLRQAHLRDEESHSPPMR